MDIKQLVVLAGLVIINGCTPKKPVAYSFTTEEIEFAPATYLCNHKELPTSGKDILLLGDLGPYTNTPHFLSYAEFAKKGVNVWMPEGLFPSNPERQINLQTPTALMQHWVEGWRPLQSTGPDIVLAEDLGVGMALELGFRLDAQEVWLINPPFHPLELEWLYLLTSQDSSVSLHPLARFGIKTYQDLEELKTLVGENPTPGLHQAGMNYILWNYLLQSDPKDFLSHFQGSIHVVFVPNETAAISEISKTNWQQTAKHQANLSVDIFTTDQWNNQLKQLFSN